jgi:plastocyanin
MKSKFLFSFLAAGLFAALVILSAPAPAQAQQNWRAAVGGQNKVLGKQAEAFLPNELWIHAGDSITWTFNAGDPHTVTFLTLGQVYPFDFTQGCPPVSPSGSAFDGTTCVSSPPSTTGQTFTVVFPKAGNYEIVCLVHSQMFGVIHVLNDSEILPHDQAFYDQQAKDQLLALLQDSDSHQKNDSQDPMSYMLSPTVISHTKHVTAGTGEIAATAGGQQGLSVVRFTQGTVQIHVGDTVEWTNLDPSTGHTITFGTEPSDLIDPSPNVTTDADGALHATISGPGQNVHSGAIFALPELLPGLTQGPLVPPTRFRITFTAPGVYPYKCAFHDNLGMLGKVIVLP